MIESLDNLVIAGPSLGRGRQVEEVLRCLPDWFGIENAIIDYRNGAESMPTWLALIDSKVVGAISVKKHFDESYEIYVMGIVKEFHRIGLGSRLIRLVEDYCIEKGGKFLQVKTLDYSRKCEYYNRTREFYLKQGFVPLETFPELWDKANPCLLLIKSLCNRI